MGAAQKILELLKPLGKQLLPDMFAEDSAAFRSRCGLVIQTARAVACRSKVIQQRCEELFPEHRKLVGLGKTK